MLRARARGIDPRPVLPPEQQSEFRLAHTLATDTNDLGVLHPLLRLMTERLGRRLRRRGLAAGRLRMRGHLCRLHRRRAQRSAERRSARCGALGGSPASLCDGQHQAAGGPHTGAHLDRLVETEAQLELWAGQTGQRRRRGSKSTTVASYTRSRLSRCLAAPLPHYPPARYRSHPRSLWRRCTPAGVPLTPAAQLSCHQTTTIFPNVALPSSTRCASAS